MLSLLRLPARASADNPAAHSADEDVRDARQRAAAHFERGYALVQQADYAAAAVEFGLAHALNPEPSVLFNLGQAHAAAGDVIAAHDTLAAFIEDSGPAIDPARRRAAEHLMRAAEGRIGRLWIEVEPSAADIEVDGRLIGKAPLDEFRRFSTGVHAVVARAAEHQTSVVNVTVRARQDSQIFLRLPPRPAEAGGMLFLYCAVPGVRVSIDGERRGEIPSAGFVAVAAGSHSLSLERPGYETERVAFRVAPGGSHEHRCAGRVDPALEPALASTLVVTQPVWAEATLHVDGRRSPSSTLLVPSGRHLVEVIGRHSERWVRAIDLASGATLKLEPTLIPTLEYARAARERESRTKLWSIVSLGTGLAFAGAATALAWAGAQKREAWTKERDALNREDLATEGVAQRLHASSRDALEIRTIEHATWGAAALGGAALLLSGYLWLTPTHVATTPWRARAGRSSGWIEYAGEF